MDVACGGFIRVSLTYDIRTPWAQLYIGRRVRTDQLVYVGLLDADALAQTNGGQYSRVDPAPDGVF
jgi:hypothetical protein